MAAVRRAIPAKIKATAAFGIIGMKPELRLLRVIVSDDHPISTNAPTWSERKPASEARGWTKQERSAFTGTPHPVKLKASGIRRDRQSMISTFFPADLARFKQSPSVTAQRKVSSS